MTCQLEGAQLQGHAMLYQAIETVQASICQSYRLPHWEGLMQGKPTKDKKMNSSVPHKKVTQ